MPMIPGDPMMGAPPGLPPTGMAQQSAPATLMQALLGPLAMMQEQEQQSLREQQAAQIQNLVGALAMPNPGGEAAMSGPAPAGLGVEAGAPEDEVPMGGVGY